MTQKTFNQTGLQNFAVAGNWTPNGIPGSSDDAEINTGALVDSTTSEIVNSIGVGSTSELAIQNNSIFDAKDGTGSNANAGVINVDQAELELGNGSFDNTGTIELTGDNVATAGNLIALGSMSLTGGGAIEMSIGGGPTANEINGFHPSTTIPTLVNVNNTISGDGTIGFFLDFTNEGVIETNNSTSTSGGTLAIQGSAGGGDFVNDGTVQADTGGTLIFGIDNSTGTIDNEATINLNSSTPGLTTRLEIAGNVTITGASHTGIIDLGASTYLGDDIVSDGKAATLTINNQIIEGNGLIGDANLTLDIQSSATIDANVAGEGILIANTASTLDNAGTLEAANGGLLIIESSIDNTGAIIASGNEGVELETVSGSGAIDIDAGSFLLVLPSAHVSSNVTFAGPSATLVVSSSGGIGGEIEGAIATDVIHLGGMAFSAGDHAVWQQTSNSGGTLSVYNNAADLASFNLTGQFNSLDFSVSAGLNTSTDITVQSTPTYPDNSGNNDEWILSDGNWVESADPGSHPAGYNVAGIGDWTGNGTDGILWFDPSTGDADEWQLANTQWSASVDLGGHPGNFQISGTGDFSGDGISDVLWTNTSGGNVQTDIWELGSNGKWAASVSPGSHPAGYTVAATGDWTGNGTDGILWYNASTGDTDEWQLNNGQWSASVDLNSHPGTGWTIAGVGDFFDNGRDDVLWTNSSGGNVQTDIWELGPNGQWIASVSPGPHPAGYQVAAIGDFTGTGTSDILWYNASTGDTDEWLINNGQWSASIDLGTHPGSAKISGVGDFNGAGNAGVLWHG